jgi:hypothetical protein
MLSEGRRPRRQPYVAVGDRDATVATATELGAATLFEPMDVPNAGRDRCSAAPVAAERAPASWLRSARLPFRPTGRWTR